jgi:hypothetical protein
MHPPRSRVSASCRRDHPHAGRPPAARWRVKAGSLGEDTARARGSRADVGGPEGRAARRRTAMRTTHHPIHHLVPLVGTSLVLASLFGCLTLPALSVAGVEPTAYQDDRNQWDYQDFRGHRDYWGRWDDRPYRRPGYGLPDRYTIHKGKKCELRCERIWGTRDYRCREYRC